MYEDKWLNKWKNNNKFERAFYSFNVIDSFLNHTPKNILDIGCGLAYESEFMQKKYSCNLYLLDGDFEDTKNNERFVKFDSASTMKFYTPISKLCESFNNRNMKYTFVDANNINIDNNVVFDLVYSNVSCGYHYPISDYYWLLKKYTNKNSVLIFDVNSRHIEKQGFNEYFKILEQKPATKNDKKIQKIRIALK